MPGHLRYWDGTSWTEHRSEVSAERHENIWNLAVLSWALVPFLGPFAAVPLYLTKRHHRHIAAVTSVRIAAITASVFFVMHIAFVAGLVFDPGGPWVGVAIVNLCLLIVASVTGLLWTRRRRTVERERDRLHPTLP